MEIISPLLLSFFSYSMILVEIATRSDLISVSMTSLLRRLQASVSLWCLLCNCWSSLTGPDRGSEDGHNVAPPSAWAQSREGRYWLSQSRRLLWGLSDAWMLECSQKCTGLKCEIVHKRHYINAWVRSYSLSLESLSSSLRNAGLTTSPWGPRSSRWRRRLIRWTHTKSALWTWWWTW